MRCQKKSTLSVPCSPERSAPTLAEANLVEAVAIEDLHQAEITSADLRRIVELMHRYRDFPLGLADASVVAVATG